MNRLFIELYLDEDVSVLVADMVCARGFVAVTTRDAGRLGQSDADQLAHAAESRQALLTHNRADFERLALDYFETGRTHSGILIAVRRPPGEIAKRLFHILNQLTADEVVDQVHYL